MFFRSILLINVSSFFFCNDLCINEDYNLPISDHAWEFSAQTDYCQTDKDKKEITGMYDKNINITKLIFFDREAQSHPHQYSWVSLGIKTCPNVFQTKLFIEANHIWNGGELYNSPSTSIVFYLGPCINISPLGIQIMLKVVFHIKIFGFHFRFSMATCIFSCFCRSIKIKPNSNIKYKISFINSIIFSFNIDDF